MSVAPFLLGYVRLSLLEIQRKNSYIVGNTAFTYTKKNFWLFSF